MWHETGDDLVEFTMNRGSTPAAAPPPVRVPVPLPTAAPGVQIAKPFQIRSAASPSSPILLNSTQKQKPDVSLPLRTPALVSAKIAQTICPFCETPFQTEALLQLHVNIKHSNRTPTKRRDF